MGLYGSCIFSCISPPPHSTHSGAGNKDPWMDGCFFFLFFFFALFWVVFWGGRSFGHSAGATHGPTSNLACSRNLGADGSLAQPMIMRTNRNSNDRCWTLTRVRHGRLISAPADLISLKAASPSRRLEYFVGVQVGKKTLDSSMTTNSAIMSRDFRRSLLFVEGADEPLFENA